MMLLASLLVAAFSSFSTQAFAPPVILHRSTPTPRTSTSSSSSFFSNSNTPLRVLADPLETPTSSSSSSAAAAPQSSNSKDGSQTQHNSIRQPNGSVHRWQVHKFGGASLATADLYRTVGDLLLQEAKNKGAAAPADSASSAAASAAAAAVPTMAIVSARGGMTDLLVRVVDCALTDFEAAKTVLQDAVDGQIEIVKALAPPRITDPIEASLRQDARHILLLVQSLRMINTVPAVTMEVVTGYGEIWSAQTLWAYLRAHPDGLPCAWMDARSVLKVGAETSSGLGEKGAAASTGGVRVEWEETAKCLHQWWWWCGGGTCTDDHQDNDGDTTPSSSSSSHQQEQQQQEQQQEQRAQLRDCDYTNGVAPIVVVTGFVACTTDGVPTTLKRSGSDYSATIFAKLTGASRVTMWKNTDGVYTADPRRVPEAFSIASLKYDEALELAYFGAQVLHPSAMVPCIDDNIPVYVRNIFNPSFPGTVVQGRSRTLQETDVGKTTNWRAKKGVIPIKGITSVDKVSLVTLEGASTLGGSNVAERFMGAMAAASINVLIITQASSESSICVAVPENEGEKALVALRDAFELELARSTIGSLSKCQGMSIIAIVGEGMAHSSGISATFMGSLALANVNIRLIAQGSSERQVAVVVNQNDTTRALRAAHQAFTLSDTTASITVLGSTGTIGTAFLKALCKQRRALIEDMGVCPRVMITANSRKMAMAATANGLSIPTITQCLDDNVDGDNANSCEGAMAETLPTDIERITAEIEADVNPHRVIIDCTNSEATSEYYERWMNSGIDVISPSRKVAAGPLDRYHRACRAQKDNFVNWQYECSVGSALPILTTLRDLCETGDKIHRIYGCVSGTMAFVLSSMNERVTFSELVSKAAEMGYCESDFRQDLTGLDMARKVVILARKVGMDIELADVELESFLPDDLASRDDLSVDDLKMLDGPMLEKFKAAEADGKRLRYKFDIDTETGKCRCFLDSVDRDDPLYRLKNVENLVAFETDRYTASPLIVKGAAAGPELAAAGIFSDLLRCFRTYSAETY